AANPPRGGDKEQLQKSPPPPLLEKRRSLDQAQFRTDADYAEIVHHGLAETGGGRFAVEVAGIESVGIAGLGEELACLCGLVSVCRRRPCELESGRDDAR